MVILLEKPQAGQTDSYFSLPFVETTIGKSGKNLATFFMTSELLQNLDDLTQKGQHDPSSK